MARINLGKKLTKKLEKFDSNVSGLAKEILEEWVKDNTPKKGEAHQEIMDYIGGEWKKP